jgi:predicted ribosome quality control (RQC) complex YloA/Tae2 family protein
MELKQQANERHKQQIINAVDDLLDYINSLQNNYIALSKNDKKKSKEVDAILTATTLIKMRIQSLNK